MSPAEQEILNRLKTSYEAYGDFRVQWQGPEGKKSQWLMFSEWEIKFSEKEVAWIPSDRTIFPAEFVLELDPEENETQDALELRSNLVEKICNENNIAYQKFHSGNKSWHFHMLLPGLLRFQTVEKRNKIRKFFAEHFFQSVGPYDQNLLNENHLIRLVGAINPKSGKCKIFVSGNSLLEQIEIPGEVVAKANREEKIIEVKESSSASKISPPISMCNCMAYACKNKLPTGNRQQVYAKNFAALCDWKDNQKEFIAAQNDSTFTEKNFEQWETFSKVKGKPMEFNCLELKKRLSEDGLRNVCLDCPYFKENYLKEVELVSPTKYGNFKVRAEARIIDLKKYYSFKDVRFKNDSVTIDEVYSIYSFRFGHGNDECYIIETPEQKMSGDSRLYLKPATQQKIELFVCKPPIAPKLLKMIGLRGVGKDGMLDDILKDFVKRQTSGKIILFEAVSGIPAEDLMNLSNEQCKIIIDDFISMGCEIDEIIRLEFLSDILTPNPQFISPERYMKYNPHSLCYTFTTKVGKTSIAERTSMRMDKVTTFALFGGGTADKERPGDLEDTILPLRVDELQEDNDLNKKNVLSFMEIGGWTIASGMHSGKIRHSSYSSMHFMGNPVNSAEDDSIEKKEGVYDSDVSLDLLNRFVTTLGKISDNYGALGSRIGFVIFLDNIQPVDPTTMFDVKTEKVLYALIDGLRRVTSDAYSELFSNQIVVNWLNGRYNNSFLKKIDAAKKIAKLIPVKEFMSQYPESYKHLRGKALKIACTEVMFDLAHKHVNVEALLERAEEILVQLQDITAESFFKIANISSGDNSLAILKLKFENYPLHLKTCILACLLCGLETGERKRFSTNTLNGQIIKINEGFHCNHSVPETLARVENRLTSYSEKLRLLGITLMKTEDGLLFQFSDFDTILNLFGDKNKALMQLKLNAPGAEVEQNA